MDKVKLKVNPREVQALESFCDWYLRKRTPAHVRIETVNQEAQFRIIQKLVPLLMAKLLVRLSIANVKGTCNKGKLVLPGEEALALLYAWTNAGYIPLFGFGGLNMLMGQVDKQFA